MKLLSAFAFVLGLFASAPSLADQPVCNSNCINVGGTLTYGRLEKVGHEAVTVDIGTSGLKMRQHKLSARFYMPSVPVEHVLFGYTRLGGNKIAIYALGSLGDLDAVEQVEGWIEFETDDEEIELVVLEGDLEKPTQRSLGKF